MIKLAESSLMLIDANGVMSNFDPERLQAKIIRCFLAAGIQEIYLAEDIALAVEFALEQSKRDEKVFALSEVNSTVVRILEDTGFPEAANVYTRGNSCSRVTFNSESETISKLIKKHLGLEGSSLDFLTGKVIEASSKLNIKNAPPTLFVELAKYYETEELPGNAIEPLPMETWEESKHWLVKMEDLYKRLNAASRNLIDAKVLRLTGVSSMFPSIRIFFMINEFVNFHGLEGPLTEMILIPYLFSASKAISNCITTAQEMTIESSGNIELPVFLNIPDMSNFATSCLQASWPECEKDCRDMVAPLCQSLSAPVFKLKIS
ncbi:hypothetical protein P0136_03015 [Lentisphaerota bacterium ZTH]|nr:hypothetical protein JYG24_05845 [Lentisphaerota bacterium]WET06973.1 hypothetical protein P0136_03015 [Lentisphaerota bacterium ZTH]